MRNSAMNGLKQRVWFSRGLQNIQAPFLHDVQETPRSSWTSAFIVKFVSGLIWLGSLAFFLSVSLAPLLQSPSTHADTDVILVDKFVDRAQRLAPLHHQGLDHATLGKPGQLGSAGAAGSVGLSTSHLSLRSALTHRPFQTYDVPTHSTARGRFPPIPSVVVNRHRLAEQERVQLQASRKQDGAATTVHGRSQSAHSGAAVHAVHAATAELSTLATVPPTVEVAEKDLHGHSHAVESAIADLCKPASVADKGDRVKAEQEDASLINEMDEAALSMDPSNFQPRRGPDGRLEPVLTLPGDTLETTPMMRVLTAMSTVTMLGIVGHAFVVSSNPLWPLLSVVLGTVAGEMLSGTFHWATDNYGSIKTPVVGFACAAFQGHHLAPWTISHRDFINNVYKIATVTLPLNLAGLVLFPASGAAFFAVMTYCQVLAQEFHRWTHTPPSSLPVWKQKLQKAGIVLPFREHLMHHKPPFDKKYCILNGHLNALLDSEPVLFWRRLEGLVYRINGQEPHSWEDPKVKEVALRTWPAAAMSPQRSKA